MSFHTAKAHFANANNYSKTEFEKQLVAGMTALTAGLSEHFKETDDRVRAVEKLVQQFKHRT